VDIGVEQPAVLRDRLYSIGDRLTLQIITAGKKIEVQVVNRRDVPTYWGFTIRVEQRSFPQFANDKTYNLVIGTARIGSKYSKVAEAIALKWQGSQSVLVAFGAPSRGLHEIAKAEGTRLDRFVDFVVNTIPEQGTATVRTEEAVFATLAIFNVNFG
jgi:methyltransferase